MQCIVLDFDGVLCNSQEECFYIACKLFASQNLNFDNKSFYLKHKNTLQSYRQYVVSGEDYFFLVKSVYMGLSFATQSEFNIYKSNNKHLIKHMREKFYKIRREFIKSAFKSWIELNPLYKNITKKIASLISEYEIYIVTTKDRDSVSKILYHNNLNIDLDNIYGREHQMSKRDCINEIILKRKLDYIAFIDDQIENLLLINMPIVGLFLAAWGYNDEIQMEMARKNNISILSIEDFPYKVIESY